MMIHVRPTEEKNIYISQHGFSLSLSIFMSKIFSYFPTRSRKLEKRMRIMVAI